MIDAGRLGYTTGACAAAAAKAALTMLLGEATAPDEIDIPFPSGERHRLPVTFVRAVESGVEAVVEKDAGDDPDITDGVLVTATVGWGREEGVAFTAGDGVGTVTKRGLAIPPGDAAVNPGPRRMITAALRELTDRPLRVTISIPGGNRLAEETYNPRLGIVNGLSVLGTTGRVRPFSCEAMRCSLACALDVAEASGVKAPVFVPGHIGESAARKHLDLTEEQLIEVGNEWGFVLDRVAAHRFERILLLGHPGKLAKLAAKEWDTHSDRSTPATAIVKRLAGGTLEAELPTTEGLFGSLAQVERERLADRVGAAIVRATAEKIAATIGTSVDRQVEVSVALIDMAGGLFGSYGDLSPWR